MAIYINKIVFKSNKRESEDAPMLLRENFASGMGRFYAWMEADSHAKVFDTQ